MRSNSAYGASAVPLPGMQPSPERRLRPSDVARLSFRLQRVKSDDLIEFPEPADGSVSKVHVLNLAFTLVVYHQQS